MTHQVALAAPDFLMEQDLLAALSGGGELSVVRRCVDAIDLVGAAASGVPTIALVSAGLPRLSTQILAELQSMDMPVIGLVTAADVDAQQRLRAIGVAVLATVTDADPSHLRQSVAGAIGRLKQLDDPDQFPSRDGGAQDVESAPVRQERGRGDDRVNSRGVLIAVSGPPGAPGRTSVAVALADELSRSNHEVLLVDADVWGACIPLVLGMWDEASGLSIACREAERASFDAAALAQCARSLNNQWRVLTGIPQLDRAAELPPLALSRVWETARSLATVTIIDMGADLGVGFGAHHRDLGSRSIDLVPDAPHRVAHSVLAAADMVIAVGCADPVGVDRLGKALVVLAEAGVAAPLVVVNRLRRSVLGAHPEDQIRTALAESSYAGDLAFIPDDPAAFDSALRDGRTLAESRPRSPARTAIQAFSNRVGAAVGSMGSGP